MRKLLHNKSFLYSLVVLVISWSLTIVLFQNEEQALKSFPIVMFVPLIVAVVFSRIPALKLMQSSGFLGNMKLAPRYYLFGIFYPIVLVLVIAAINLTFGISSIQTSVLKDQSKLIALLTTFIPALLSVLGEEAGWRGYLLPSLTEKYSKLLSSVITGIVWAIFHMPVLYFLSKAYDLTNPGVIVLVQAGTVFTISFAFAYIYFKSQSLVPVLLLHAIWNLFNPYVLGNLYRNESGVLKGDIFIQNGEGVIGLIVIAAMSLFFAYRIKKMNLQDASHSINAEHQV